MFCLQSLQKCTDFHTDGAKFIKPTYDMGEEVSGVGKHFSQRERKDRCRGRAPWGGGSAPTRARQPYQGAAVAAATTVCFL